MSTSKVSLSENMPDTVDKWTQTERDLLWSYLAISAKQLDNGEFSNVTAESIIAEGCARRANEVLERACKEDIDGPN